MFEEGQLYSPVTQSASGAVTVHLGADHPGFQDAVYRERRNEIAASALAWERGTVPAPVAYTDAENEVWRLVTAELAPSTSATRCASSSTRRRPSRFPRTRTATLRGHRAPRAADRLGLSPGARARRPAEFYGSLAEAVFHSTQYVRHPSQPLYTPEPDIIHEVIGPREHARLAALRRA